jgi:signal transduction histidine kinase
VDSFNRVLERLEQGYRIQQEFLSTAAHELKTPLALIRAQIELIEDGHDRSSLLNDVKHMTRQVQQLLLLAEASEVQNYSFTVVDVQEVAQEAANYLQRMADAADVNVVTPDNASGVQWLADRGALFTLFKNMLENAIQHAPPGTEVRVEVNTAAVSVRDWGPGVNQEQLSQIFSRFWRGAHRRDHGAGLGLTICQEIALAHGWTLSAHRANPGLRLCLSPPTTEQRKQLA